MTRLRLLRWAGFIALWSFVGLVLSVEVYFNLRVTSPAVRFGDVALTQFQRALFWAILAPGVFWLRRRVPLTSGRWIGGVAFHVTTSFLVMAAYYLLRIVWITLSESMAMSDFWSYAYHSFYGRNLIDMLFYWAVIGIAYALDIRERFQRESLRSARLESKLVEAELKALKHQLNPHFLFNTMNTISVLVREARNDQAVQLIARLSSLLRMTLENTRVQTVTLRQELEFLVRYLEIQAARFGDKLTFKTAIDSAAFDAVIPNLILQPAVENAILHGIAQKTEPGLVEIAARVRGGRLELEVRDDGPGFEASAENAGREGIGLTNTRVRLERHYGKDFQMVLRSERGRGVTVAMVLPLQVAPAKAD
ncbi:MAG TPA: histidine kinase [Candidatus Didemnitutus sp.]|nr:histidine kinase [Candidatus Didemnitutus sp.]